MAIHGQTIPIYLRTGLHRILSPRRGWSPSDQSSFVSWSYAPSELRSVPSLLTLCISSTATSTAPCHAPRRCQLSSTSRVPAAAYRSSDAFLTTDTWSSSLQSPDGGSASSPWSPFRCLPHRPARATPTSVSFRQWWTASTSHLLPASGWTRTYAIPSR
jgi:hypothetical protein